MVVMGFCYTNPLNWTPFVPAQFGVSGVMRGATGTVRLYGIVLVILFSLCSIYCSHRLTLLSFAEQFFGYLGYDSGKS